MAMLNDSPNWNIHDDFYTRKKSWEQITPFIEQNKTIYEFCLLNSNEQSKIYLQELGYNVIGNNTIDFLEYNEEEGEADILVSNIPFSTEIKQKILKKLVKDLYFIYPSTKIHYDKYMEGELQETRNNTSFYSIYVCYKVINKNIWI